MVAREEALQHQHKQMKLGKQGSQTQILINKKQAATLRAQWGI